MRLHTRDDCQAQQNQRRYEDDTDGCRSHSSRSLILSYGTHRNLQHTSAGWSGRGDQSSYVPIIGMVFVITGTDADSQVPSSRRASSN